MIVRAFALPRGTPRTPSRAFALPRGTRRTPSIARTAALAAPVLAFVLAAFPHHASARAWHGLNPGSTKKSEVVKKFGSPNRELPMTSRYAGGIVYQGKSSQDFGAEEAQFFFDDKGKLIEIFVFPEIQLKREDVVKAYGATYEERRTDDFRLYFQYKNEGFVVFFAKDNESVYQLQYTPGDAAAPTSDTKSASSGAPKR